MFKQFKDIKARDETERDESVLEKLITQVSELIFNPKLRIYDSATYFQRLPYIEDKIVNVDYSENDIVSLLRAGVSFNDINKIGERISKEIFGLYSGCLLTRLTEERHKHGLTTNIVIDNINKDYILFGARLADSITFNNCQGEYLGLYIGVLKGHIGKVIFNNCQGGYLGRELGAEQGHVDQVIYNNCQSNFLGQNNSNFNGSIDKMIINDCKGTPLGSSVGSYKGKVKQVIINNCEGKEIGSGIGFEGHVEQVIVNNCKGNDIGKIIDGVIDYNISNHKFVEQVIINDPEELEKQGLTGLIELVDSMTGKNYQEIQDIARRIGEYSNV